MLFVSVPRAHVRIRAQNTSSLGPISGLNFREVERESGQNLRAHVHVGFGHDYDESYARLSFLFWRYRKTHADVVSWLFSFYFCLAMIQRLYSARTVRGTNDIDYS